MVGTAVTFSGAASTAPSGQTLSYAWNFGDSSTGTGVSPSHTYTTVGSFTVTLTVTASGGGTATATAMATITTALVPVASAGGPYMGVVGTAITFSGAASTAPAGQTLSYAWNFGDSSTGTGASPTHTYTTAGSFTVTLTVTASGGGTATSTATATITAAPVASAGGPYTGVVGTAVSFSGAASTAPAGQTLSYAWNFGDSSTGTGVSPIHTYTTAGSFTVTLTVTASGGGTATSTATATITAAPVPVASAGGPYTGVVGTAVSFNGAASTAPSGQTLSYAWNFGDSSTATGVSPTHTYTTAGSFTVTLTVTASGGGTATSTATATITAASVPVASAGGPYTGVVGTAVSFNGAASTAPSGQTLSYAWNFGDSSTGTGVIPTHTYTTAGSFTVILTVTASGGGTATSTATATITAAPVASAGGPYTGVVGTAVSFSGAASTAPSGQTLSYAWNFGDSSTGTGVSPTHTYTTTGSFTVTLTVTASGGGTATSTATATITAAPVPVASAGGPYTGVVGTAVSFNGAASTAPSGQTLSYAWNFGDSSTGTGVSPIHTYTTAGSFTVTLTVTASGGGTATSTATATITAAPVASAGGPYTGVVGTAVSFSGAASTAPAGQTLSYAWNFGDSSTGTGVSPTHTYTTAGSFTVTLTVTASGGRTATSTATATITAAPVPVASAGGPYTGVVGTAVSFNGAASTAPSGQTLSYAWNFGDSSTATGVSPTHTYTTAGSFTVTLTVTASGGGTATSTATATITAASVPVASAGGPYTGVVGTAVSFNGAASTAPSGQTLSYAWNFGDSSTGTGVIPTHTYTTAGSFTVILTVTASGGGTATSTATATITAAPVASAGGPYTGVVGTAVSFSGAASTAPSGQTLSYAWNFGDSSTGTGVSPTHTYTTTGSFTVTLTVTASGGGTATSTATATITAAPVPVASAGGPYTGVVGTAVSFNGAASTAPSGQTLSYAWNFGDSSTGTGVSPIHTYTTAGSFTVTLTVTASGGGTATSTATATITAAPVASAGGPYTGVVGTAVSFSGAASTAPAGQTLSYAWNFGDSSTGTGVSPTHTYTTAGSFTVTLTVTASGGRTATSTATATITAAPAPTISGFSPAAGPIGTVITVSGSNLITSSGAVPQVTLTQQGGSTLAAPVSASNTTSLSFVIPPGAATGPIVLLVGTQSVTSATALTVTTSSSFSVSVTPGTGTLIQGQSAALAVTVNSTNGFSALATLAVTGVPSGVTASFQPSSVAAGQVSVLTLSAPTSQPIATSTLTVSASASIDGQSLTQSATASIKVTGVTTSFLGRTVVDNAQNTPIAGVTIKFLGVDDKGNKTGCSGQTLSDGAGNFFLTSLPAACIGPQLISYDGTTATSPAGKYAGVNLSYTLVSGQVTSSPVLVHLPRIDNAETVQVQQNATTDQVFAFSTIPGLQVTVYAGTTISLADGTQPNPFPLVAMDIPLDQLPEKTPTNGMLMNFVVAFQPANATASQPVAVTFPNPLNLAPATAATLTTLDPTRGYMVPYGTTTVASDGRTFIPDLDPAHPGHRYGLVHFDWHTPLSALAPTNNQGADHCDTCNPIDLATGIEHYTTTDLQIRGGRGSIGIQRTYRSLNPNPGPFGIGTGFNYSVALNVLAYTKGTPEIGIFMPDGNKYSLSGAPDGTLINGTIPELRGTVLTPNQSAGIYTLRQLDGTLYTFTVFPSQGIGGAYLTSITDLNGNTTTLTLNPAQPLQVLQVTDPVGRIFNLTYDGLNRVTQIVDPIGRKVTYGYYPQGTLQTFTDANGGTTSYTYDSNNNVVTITDPRGIVTETNTYNETGDQRVTQQVDANGGVTKFAYTLLNPMIANELVSVAGGTSPVLQTVMTDPLGHQTTYRFNPAGFLQSATDPTGQTTTLTHDAAHNNLITAYQGAGVCVICGNRANGDTSFTYDQFGNRLTSTDALGHTTTFTYDLRFNKVNSITDAQGDVTKLAYDANGNLVSITDANGNTTQLSYDGFGGITQVTDPTGAKTMVAYDSFGNITSVTDALGHATSLSYDAVSRLTQVQDALGRNSTTAYDKLDRVSSQTDPLGHTTSFGYDKINDLLSYTDAKGNTVQFQYDSLARLHTRTSQLGAIETYQYDADSNLNQYTDRRGQTSTYGYDPDNRLTNETYTDATVARNYDANGRLLTVNDSQGGEFGFGYDAAGGLLTQEEPTGTVQYTRDLLERVKTRQVAGQSAVTYGYDFAGNMLTASSADAGVTYQYDARNLPKTLTRTNGVVTTYGFDPLGQLLSIIHGKIGAAAMNTQTYMYDAVGNGTTISNDISQALITQSAGATVDNANELKTLGSTSYSYDANGNRLTETNSTGALNYEWDGRNRLYAVKDISGNTTSLQYDFTRNLLKLSQSSGPSTMQQTFVVDSLTNVASTTAQSGSPVSILTGNGIDSHFASIDSSGNTQFGIEDSLGSIVGITNGNGKLFFQTAYEPYGQSMGAGSIDYPFAFTGRVPIIGNVEYFRNRYYDAGAGRFLSEDPAGATAGNNLYGYAGNNPTGFDDPTGLRRWPDYYSLSAGIPLVSFTLTVDAYGDIFLGGGVGLGKGGLRTPGASLNANYLLAPDSAICQKSVYNFLHGTKPSEYSQTFSVGGIEGVGGFTYTENSSGMYSVGAGLATPGGGYTTGPTYFIGNPFSYLVQNLQQAYSNPYYGGYSMTIQQAFGGR